MDFPLSEYAARLAVLHREMATCELDAIILTGDRNIRYLSGYHEQGWFMTTRAKYLVIPAGEMPIAVLASNDMQGFEDSSWVRSTLHWPPARFIEDGVSLLIDAVSGDGQRTVRRIGIESGHESRWQAPLIDLYRLQNMLDGVEFFDAHAIMKTLRLHKSENELAVIRDHCQRISRLLDDTRGFRAFRNEQDVYFSMAQRFAEARVERMPYLSAISGVGGCRQIMVGPLDNPIDVESTLYVSTGSSSKGYFCDITRNYQFFRENNVVDEHYAILYRATEAALDAAGPGVPVSDVWQAMAREIGKSAPIAPGGRMGYGFGLDLSEEPSISARDETVLAEGMTITIEPSITFQQADGERIMLHEENVVITGSGAELLSIRAPAEIHKIGY